MNNVRVLLLAFSLGVITNACKQEDPPLPDNLVQFETAEQGFEADKAETEVKVTLSRSVDAATPITIELQPTGVAYGTQFTTAPAATNNALAVTVPAGSSVASFKVTKAANLFLSGTETIRFAIKSAGSPVMVGTTAASTLKFSSIVSTGSSLKLNGGEGGASAINSVFVDLSNNAQTSVARNSWDLGFYNTDDFRVVINGTTGASAKALDKTDLNAVTAADTAGFKNILVLGQGNGGFDIIDDVEGDMSKTVIKAVSATDADNKVYIVNPGSAGVTTRPWYKIRVVRKGTGYTLQYAPIAETTYKTLDITKDATHNFNYVSFDKGAVAVEPAKANWDFEWTLATYKASPTIPYTFSDFVFVNYLGGAQAAEVLTSTVSYDAFVESNVANVTFSTARNAIGSNWRVTSGGTVGVKTDRFYVIKDTAGNVYKLKFLNFHPSDGGVRGYPNIEYKLVKKGA